MPLFDRSSAPYGITPEVVDLANKAAADLAARKTSIIPTIDAESGRTVPGLTRSYLQAHIRRCLTFLEAGIAELNAGRSLVTNLCVRAIYENIAAVCDFADKFAALLDAGDYKRAAEFVSNRAFATRLDHLISQHGSAIAAPNILTLIDKMNKVYPGYREAYDHLSEIVHPNGLGAVVYFVRLGGGQASISDDAIDPPKAHASLIMAAFLLSYVELAIAQVERRL